MKAVGFVAVIVGLIGVLIVSVGLAITFGSVDISLSDVYNVIFYEWFHFEYLHMYAEGSIHDIIWLIRFPRIILAIAVGMGLAVSGLVMQAVVKNPIADPYILGVSSGASLGATLAILLGVGAVFGSSSVGVMAFLGAVGTSFIVLFIANNKKMGTGVGKLILAGMAVSTLCTAFSSFIIYIVNDRSATQEITFWTMGSLAGAKWQTTIIVLLIVIVTSLIFWSQFRALNIMLLGDETAITLGINTVRLRKVYMILVALMVGFVVYSAGIIGFVGLMIPHIVRAFVGTNHMKTIPLAGLIGAIFVIWADVLSRIILKHTEIPIGVLISLIGAPSFIYIMFKQARTFGGGS